MKARFLEQQPPVKFVVLHGTTYVYICVNEKLVSNSDTEEGETEAYEYDYNEFFVPTEEIDRKAIIENPEGYVLYDPNKKMDYEAEIKKLQDENAELHRENKELAEGLVELTNMIMEA